MDLNVLDWLAYKEFGKLIKKIFYWISYQKLLLVLDLLIKKLENNQDYYYYKFVNKKGMKPFYKW